MFKWKKRCRMLQNLLAKNTAHITYVMVENKFLKANLEKLGVDEIFDEKQKITLEFLGAEFKKLDVHFEHTIGKTIDEAMAREDD